MKMRVLRHEADATHISPWFPAPDPPLQPGDRLRFNVEAVTLKPESYFVGDVIEIVAHTDEAPHGLITTRGNWLVRGKDGEVTVWSNIEWSMADGHLNLLPREAPEA